MQEPTPDQSLGAPWWRRWAYLAGLGGVFVVAVSARLGSALHTAGGLFGLGNYDDGVHFAAALGLVNGLLPYRDFLLLHPPGVVLAMAPFAALSWLIGEPWAMAAARIGWMTLGGINTVLCALVLRPIGRLAGLVVAMVYALLLGAVYIEYTTLLEPPATTVLLLGMVITRLLGSGANIGSRHYLVAGLVLGVSPVMKIWGVVTVLVVVTAIALRRGARPALVTLGGAIGTTTVLCLPFFLSAPGEMWRMVVVAQLSRRRDQVPLPTRLNDILGVHGWVQGSPDWEPVTVVMLVIVLAALVVCFIRTELRVIAALLVAHGAIVLVTPMWFLHYAGLTAAPIALAVGAAVGVAIDWATRAVPLTWLPGLIGAVAIACAAVLVIPLQRLTFTNNSFPGKTLSTQLAGRPGCFVTDFPMTLIQMNLLQRNLDRGCPLVVDIGGYSYYHVNSSYSDVSRRKNKDFQATLLAYYRSGSAVIPVRFSTLSGYSKSTARTIERWPVIAKSGPYVIREPQPAANR